jgi:hypothetical protein
MDLALGPEALASLGLRDDARRVLGKDVQEDRKA